jgi:hypothetical protein
MKRLMMLITCLLACLLARQSHDALASAAESNVQTMTAQLVSPISARANRAGDKVSAIILSPEAYRGAPLEGEIKEAKSSGDLQKTSSLQFFFSSLTLDGKTIPVRADVVSFQNSKGQPGVDEQGRIVRKSSGIGKALAVAGIGAALGAILDGRKGAAIGAGIGLAAGFVFVSVAVKGPDVAFDSKSTFELAVRPCEECTGGEPTPAQRQFAHDEFSFSYPAQWRAYWDGRSPQVTVAPPSALVSHQGGNVAIGYGAVAGFYHPSTGAETLRSATYRLIRALIAHSPELELIPGSQPTEAENGQLLLVPMVRRSSLEADPEIQLVLTMMRPQGLFYFIGIAPASRSRDISGFSQAILQSLRFRE